MKNSIVKRFLVVNIVEATIVYQIVPIGLDTPGVDYLVRSASLQIRL